MSAKNLVNDIVKKKPRGSAGNFSFDVRPPLVIRPIVSKTVLTRYSVRPAVWLGIISFISIGVFVPLQINVIRSQAEVVVSTPVIEEISSAFSGQGQLPVEQGLGDRYILVSLKDQRLQAYENGERVWQSELSSIDSAIFFYGAIIAGEYFKGTEVEKLAREIFERADWDWFRGRDSVLKWEWTPENGFKYRTSASIVKAEITAISVVNKNAKSLSFTAKNKAKNTR